LTTSDERERTFGRYLNLALSNLVDMGVLATEMRDGKVGYLLSFKKKAEQLIEDGEEIHKAYYKAIREHAPSIDEEFVIDLIVMCVHGTGDKGSS